MQANEQHRDMVPKGNGTVVKFASNETEHAQVRVLKKDTG